MRKATGYILMNVLLFLQITSLLGLSSLKIRIQRAHENNRLAAYAQLKMKARKELRLLEARALLEAENCSIGFPDTQALREKNLAGWQSHACRTLGDKTQNYYFFETLGVDSCAFIENDPGFQAAYYRLHLLIVSEQDSSQSLYLQRSFVCAVKAKTKSACETRMHAVHLGRQADSWL